MNLDVYCWLQCGGGSWSPCNAIKANDAISSNNGLVVVTVNDDEALRDAIEHYAQDDIYRGLAALTALRADRVPGALRRPFSEVERRERRNLPPFQPTMLFDVAAY
eukprot:COSAG05_NODE_1225_length_5460_cov_6.458497_3_plen_106_part_00